MEYTKNCPKCGKRIFYKAKLYLDTSIKKNCVCTSCRNLTHNNKGEHNGFFGKTFTPEIKAQIISKLTGRKLTGEKLASFRVALKARKLNTTPLYELWLKKFGRDIADEKRKLWVENLSKASTGSNNPMFGKPSPSESGHGWCGQYEGLHFRSLLELAYLVQNTHQIISAETKTLSIIYLDENGRTRTYFADFLVDGSILVECKPKYLINEKRNIHKFDAARIFCKDHNLEFRIVTPIRLTKKEIKELHALGKVKFSNKYEEVFKTL
jgi:hypothetical protein